MSYAPSDVPPTLVWRPGSGLSGPMVYDDFVELAAACASTPTVIEVQCDGSLQPPGTDLILPAGTFDLNGAILTGPRNLVQGLTPIPDPTPVRVIGLNGTTLRGLGGIRDGVSLVNAQGPQPVIEIVEFGVWVQALAVLIGSAGPVLGPVGSMIAFMEAGADWENDGSAVVILTAPNARLQVNVGLDSSIDEDAIIAADPTQEVQLGRSTITSRVGAQPGVVNLFVQSDGELENLRFNGPFGAFAPAPPPDPPDPENMQVAWDRLVQQVVAMLGHQIDGLGEPLPVLLAFPVDKGAPLTTQRAYFVDTTASGGTLNLPPASHFGSRGRIFVKKSGNHTIGIQPSGSDTIDGEPLLELVKPNESVILISNGSTVWGVF